VKLLQRTALRSVPRDWRDDVARDLQEERTAGAGALRMAARALGIGMRLRLARSTDSLASGGSPSGRAPRRFPMHDFGRDIRLAIRSALRQPGYAFAIVATLAIGIGANTAIFSVFNWIMFRPVPGVAEPARLFTVRYQSPKSTIQFFLPYVDYAYLRDRVTSFEGLAASLPLTVYLGDRAGDEGIRVDGEIVTVNYFDVLGAEPALGRGFTADEEHTLDGIPPVVISHELWDRRYARDGSILGRTIALDGRPFVVVGVAPAAFRGRSLVSTSDLWAPVGAHMSLLPHYGSKTLTSRGNSFFGDAVGRLRHGVSLAQAQAEATAVADALPEFALRGPSKARSSIKPVLYAGLGHSTYAQERLTTAFRLLMGAVGLVLLLACANAGNLLLARTAARRREIAVRQAIGAGRLRIIRQQLAEGLVLSLAAGVAGLALAVWMTSLFDGMRILNFLPEVEGVSLDLRVAGFALAASLVTTLLFATAPAIAGSRVDLLGALKDGQTASRRGRQVLRGGLVVLQITVSLVLLVGAALFVRTLVNIRALDLGLNIDGLSAFLADPSRLGHDPERSQRMLREIATRLDAAPGIERAAVTWSTPYGNMRGDVSFRHPEDPATSHSAQTTAVSSGYFETMGIPLLAGRDFTETEFGRRNTASGVIILSRQLAESIFPNGGAVGSRLRVDYPENMDVEVVGIVGDVRGRPVTAQPEPFAYEPGGQRWPISWGHIVVRSSLPTTQVAAAARAVLQGVDSAFTPPLVESFDALLERTLAEQRLFARLSTVFAAVAALLAGIGIYAMMAGAVTERRREFGIRLALGAAGVSVLRLVVRSALTLGLLGVGVGLAASLATRHVIESRLFGVTALDPISLTLAAIGIILLCTIASLVPAVRAARIDPVRSLRVE
jgi:predicted permease